jgi:predicted transcriptional regulator
MMKMKKENKQTKKWYQPLLTHKTHVSNHLIGSTKHKKSRNPIPNRSNIEG